MARSSGRGERRRPAAWPIEAHSEAKSPHQGSTSGGHLSPGTGPGASGGVVERTPILRNLPECAIKISIIYPRPLDTPALAARRPSNGAITGGPDGSVGPGFGAAVAGPGRARADGAD